MTSITVSCDQPLSRAPEWVQLVPAGRSVARDGRRFVLDNPQELIERFNARGVDLAVDYEHQVHKQKPDQTGPIPAAGWIKELASRKDGLWGRVEWTGQARQLIAAKEYRYLSPSMTVDKTTNRITALLGAGLVHNPALNLVALASETPAMPNDPETDLAPIFTEIISMLGLDEDATAQDVLAKIKELAGKVETAGQELAVPDPRKYVPIEVFQDAMRGQADGRAERAKQKVQAAFDKGYLTGAMKPWALQLCQTDEAAFDRFLETSVPAYASLTKPLLSGAPGAGHHLQGEDEASVCRQLGLSPEALKE